MLLSENVFDGVAGLLGAEMNEALGGQQRRGPRVTLRTRLTLLPCPHGLWGPIGPPLAVPVRDLSRGGLRFLLPRRLALETQFILFLPRPNTFDTFPAFQARTDNLFGGGSAPSATDAAPLAVLCSVAYWQPLAKDLFAIGAQFVQVLSAAELPVELPDLTQSLTPRIVLEGMAGNEPAGEAALALLQRAVS